MLDPLAGAPGDLRDHRMHALDGLEVAEVIAGYLLTGEVRNAVNLPYLDAKTYEQVRPYLTLGEKRALRPEDFRAYGRFVRERHEPIQ